MKKLLYKINSPCKKCPYKLGLVQFVQNPCPQCKLNKYDTYERLVNGKYRLDEIIRKDIYKKSE
jgi:cytochrome c1